MKKISGKIFRVAHCQSQERLRTGVRQMSELLFDGIQKKKEMLEIAERLRTEGVSEEIISKCIPC